MDRDESPIRTLTERVDGYAAWDPTEEGHRRATLELLRSSPAPLDRNSFDPGHVCGSAFVACKTTGRILLIFHSKLERWLQPGGHAEPGESDPRQIAIREAREETGLLLPETEARLFDIDVHAIPARKQDPRHLHFDFRYLCIATTETVEAATDAVEARWFDIEEARERTRGGGLQRMIRKYEMQRIR